MNNLNKLIGVVICGGLSLRMESDKSLLNYHGKPQWQYIYELLKPYCDDLVISCNSDQAKNFSDVIKIIVDKNEFKNHGPISGYLSVLKDYPDHSILLVGCDYPNINSHTIRKLISSRDKNASAVCYKNQNGIIEPLITIYENVFHSEILKRFNENNFSLREFLENTNVISIIPDKYELINSVDTKEEFENHQSITKNVFNTIHKH